MMGMKDSAIDASCLVPALTRMHFLCRIMYSVGYKSRLWLDTFFIIHILVLFTIPWICEQKRLFKASESFLLWQTRNTFLFSTR